MKLVELLAKVVGEWPKGAEYAVQDGDRRQTIKYGKTKGNLGIKAEGHSLDVWQNRSWGFTSNHDFDHDELASDFLTAIVTKAQWQAERDRQKGGEWKRHRAGRNQPVNAGVRVEVKLRCGDVQQGNAHEFIWLHSECDVAANIMQYRVISQPQAEDVPMIAPGDTREYKGPFPCTPAGEPVTELEFDIQFQHGVHMEAKTDQIDGPIKWRDTVNELDAYIEGFTREREALINRLALEGFSLLPAMTAVMGVADELPTFRDWMVGDIVEVISTENFAGVGLRVGDQMPIVDTDSRDGTVKVVSGSWGDEDNYKFIRRP